MSKSKENSSQKCTQKNQNRQNLVKNVKRSRTSRESSQNTRGSLTRCIGVNTENRDRKSAKKCKKRTKSGNKIQKPPNLPRIVAKHKGIPYPVHRGKNRESQVTKVAKRGDSAKHRYSLDDTKFRKVQRSVLKLWKT